MHSFDRGLLGFFLAGVVEGCTPDPTAPSTSAMYALRRVGDQLLPAAVPPAPRGPRYIADTLLLSPSTVRGARFTVYRITVLETPHGERSHATTRLTATRRGNLLRVHSCPEGGGCPASVSLQAASRFWFVGDLLFEEVSPGSRVPPRVYSRVRD